MKVRTISPVKEFQKYAKKKNGYRGYSRLKKEELRKLISKPPPDYKAIEKRKSEERRQRGEYTRKELDMIAKNAGLRGYSKLKKDDLNEKLRENYIFSSDILDIRNLQGHLVIPSKFERLLRLLIALQISMRLRDTLDTIPIVFLQQSSKVSSVFFQTTDRRNLR